MFSGHFSPLMAAGPTRHLLESDITMRICPLIGPCHSWYPVHRPNAHGMALLERTRGALASWWQQRRRSRRGNTITILFPGYQSLLPFEFVIEQDVCDEPSQ